MRDALALEPDFAAAHFALGDALGRQSRWLESAAAYQQAVRLQPASVEAQGNLVLAWCRASRYDAACEALLRLIKLRPGRAELHLLRGALLRRVSRPEEAIRSFRWALNLPLSTGGQRFHLGEEILGRAGWVQVVRSYRESLMLARREPAWLPPEITAPASGRRRLRDLWRAFVASTRYRRQLAQDAREAARKQAVQVEEQAEALRHCYLEVMPLPVDQVRTRPSPRPAPRRKSA